MQNKLITEKFLDVHTKYTTRWALDFLSPFMRNAF